METKTAEQLIDEGLIDSEDLRLFPESFTGTTAVIFTDFLAITAFMRNSPQIGENIWSNVRKAREGMLLLFKKEDFEKIVKPLLP